MVVCTKVALLGVMDVVRAVCADLGLGGRIEHRNSVIAADGGIVVGGASFSGWAGTDAFVALIMAKAEDMGVHLTYVESSCDVTIAEGARYFHIHVNALRF